MSKKLDNWAFGLGVTGLISLFVWVNPAYSSSGWGGILFNIFDLARYVGLIMGIIALAKGSNQKWKPISAIILFILTGLISIVIFFIKMNVAGF